MRSKAILILVALSVMLPAGYAHHGPAKVTIDAAAAKQPAVAFDHEKHSTKLVKSCDTCHHMNKGMTADKKPAKVQKCSTCHLNAKGNVPSMREASMTKNPFHSLCIDCHKTSTPKGPTVCKDCHVKK